MKELNLEVSKKVWTIQLGDCEVESIAKGNKFPLLLKSKDSRTCLYTDSLKYNESDNYRSIFESNPFERSVDTNETIEPKLVRQQNDGWVENKAELIKILYSIYMESKEIELREIAKDKLQKVLESI